MEKIEKLTPEQEKDLEATRDKWLKIEFRTDEINKDEAIKKIHKVYETLGMKKLDKKDIHFVVSPLELQNKLKELMEKDQEDPKKYDEYMGEVFHSQFEASWLSFYDFIIRNFDFEFENKEIIKELVALSQVSGIGLYFEECCIVCDRPVHIHLDERNNLHDTNDAALKYRDGVGIYSVHGINIPKWIIKEPEKITAQHIDDERNVELRRIMIDKMGQENYLKDGNSVEIHRDDFGILYKKEIPDDEDLVMVKVVNSTPEPDGTFKDYFIRVPPNMRTAHEAVAWTAGKTVETYKPIIET
jgi:hypothetical protein